MFALGFLALVIGVGTDDFEDTTRIEVKIVCGYDKSTCDSFAVAFARRGPFCSAAILVQVFGDAG